MLRQTKIWDCFLIDQEFHIERPRRLYRQGIGLFAEGKQKALTDKPDPEKKGSIPDDGELQGAEGFSGGNIGDPNDPSTTSMAKDDPSYLKNASAHTFYLTNAERRMKVVAKTERQMDQFIASIEKMAEKSIWAGKNRFGSFAPIRLNVAAQWLVDGVSASHLLIRPQANYSIPARLLLESIPGHPTCEREDLHTRLVAQSRALSPSPACRKRALATRPTSAKESRRGCTDLHYRIQGSIERLYSR